MLTDHVSSVDAQVAKCCEILISNSSSTSSSVAANVVQELGDKECRKKYVLFFNIPEPDALNSEADRNYASNFARIHLILTLQF